jgi:hypothetical protein
MSDRDPPIIVFGARGFIGASLSNFLVSQGRNVTTLDVYEENLIVDREDLDNCSDPLSKIIGSFERDLTIIFILALAREPDESISPLIQSLEKMSFERVIYISSLSADMPPQLLEKSRYAKDKAISEAACAKAGFLSLRLGLVFSDKGFGLRAGTPPFIKLGKRLLTIGGSFFVYPISIELVVTRLAGLCDDSFWKYLDQNWRGKDKIFSLVDEPWTLTNWVKHFYQSKGYITYCFVLQTWMLAVLQRTLLSGELRDRIVGMYWISKKRGIHHKAGVRSNPKAKELIFGISPD